MAEQDAPQAPSDWVDGLMLGTRVILAEAQNAELQQQVADLQQQLLATKQELLDAMEGIDKQEERMDTLKRDLAREQEAYDRERQRRKRAKEDLHSADEDIRRAKEALRRAEEAHKKQIAQLAKKLDAARAELVQESRKACDWQRENQTLRAELESQSAQLESVRRIMTHGAATAAAEPAVAEKQLSRGIKRFNQQDDDQEYKNSRQKLREKYIGTRLCYHGSLCSRFQCYFAHSVRELLICPRGQDCHGKCPSLLHTEADRTKLLEKIAVERLQPIACKEFEDTQKCTTLNCNKIHQ